MLNDFPLASTNLVWEWAGCFEPDLAFERGRDARAEASRRVGIDLQRFLDVLDSRLRIVVCEEARTA